jgi:mevalonyl-CoA ligase
VRERLAQFKQRIYLVFGTKKLFMVCPEAGSGKLRKPDLRVIGKRILRAIALQTNSEQAS